jgi:hypothetical protein
MSSRPTRNRQRRQLSRAELKAYEARRAAERRRVSAATAGADAEAAAILHADQAELTYEMTRDEEFAVIRSDLRRLLIIVAVLVAMLVVFTIILR